MRDKNHLKRQMPLQSSDPLVMLNRHLVALGTYLIDITIPYLDKETSNARIHQSSANFAKGRQHRT
jgi:hypothetical protein